MSKYKTILADPPWPYRHPKAVVGNGGRGSQAGNAANIIQANVHQHYSTMSMSDLKSLPIENLSDDNAHLYLWTTNAFMVEAHELARCWGFQPKTILTWTKTKLDKPYEPSMKTGYWYRSSTEHVVFAVRGKLRLKTTKGVPTAFLHKRLPHSVKPDVFYESIEANSPGPYLELFARRKREGWDCWGNEVDSTIDLDE